MGSPLSSDPFPPIGEGDLLFTKGGSLDNHLISPSLEEKVDPTLTRRVFLLPERDIPYTAVIWIPITL